MSVVGANGPSTSAAAAGTGARGAHAQGDAARLRQAAEELEGLFVTQLLRASGVAGAGTFARVPGGGVLQGLAEEAFGRALADQADFGLAESLFRELSGAARTETMSAWSERSSVSLAPSTRLGPSGERHDPPAAIPGLGTERQDRAVAPRAPDRLTRFAGEIREAAERFGVDPDLIRAVILQESGGDPGARSMKGARGLMQILDGTARELGLRRPFDPRENILAGTRYLAGLLERNGGDLPLALASYNAGPGAVSRHGGIPPYRETLRYVSGVLALRESLRARSGQGEPR